MTETEIVNVETGELVPYDASASWALFGTTDPELAMIEASRYAKTFTDVVRQQGLFATISGKEYLTVEAWQTIGGMAGVTAVGEGEPEPVEIDGVKGFKSTMTAVRNGVVIGRATAYCMRDEARWKTQPIYALASMAQTRATSKALKGPLGHIVKIAGFATTPADEIPFGDEPKPTYAAVPVVDDARLKPVEVIETPDVLAATKPQQNNIHRLIAKLAKEELYTEAQIREGMQKAYGTQITTMLTKAQAIDLITELKKLAGEEES